MKTVAPTFAVLLSTCFATHYVVLASTVMITPSSDLLLTASFSETASTISLVHSQTGTVSRSSYTSYTSDLQFRSSSVGDRGPQRSTSVSNLTQSVQDGASSRFTQAEQAFSSSSPVSAAVHVSDTISAEQRSSSHRSQYLSAPLSSFIDRSKVNIDPTSTISPQGTTIFSSPLALPSSTFPSSDVTPSFTVATSSEVDVTSTTTFTPLTTPSFQTSEIMFASAAQSKTVDEVQVSSPQTSSSELPLDQSTQIESSEVVDVTSTVLNEMQSSSPNLLVSTSSSVDRLSSSVVSSYSVQINEETSTINAQTVLSTLSSSDQDLSSVATTSIAQYSETDVSSFTLISSDYIQSQFVQESQTLASFLRLHDSSTEVFPTDSYSPDFQTMEPSSIGASNTQMFRTTTSVFPQTLSAFPGLDFSDQEQASSELEDLGTLQTAQIGEITPTSIHSLILDSTQILSDERINVSSTLSLSLSISASHSKLSEFSSLLQNSTAYTYDPSLTVISSEELEQDMATTSLYPTASVSISGELDQVTSVYSTEQSIDFQIFKSAVFSSFPVPSSSFEASFSFSQAQSYQIQPSTDFSGIVTPSCISALPSSSPAYGTTFIPEVTDRESVFLAAFFTGRCGEVLSHIKELRRVMPSFLMNVTRSHFLMGKVKIMEIQCEVPNIKILITRADKNALVRSLNSWLRLNSSHARELHMNTSDGTVLMIQFTSFKLLDKYSPTSRPEDEQGAVGQITMITTAVCICIVLIAIGVFVFMREIRKKRNSEQLNILQKTDPFRRRERVALTRIPKQSSAYERVEMKEELPVEESHNGSLDAGYSTIGSHLKTSFPVRPDRRSGPRSKKKSRHLDVPNPHHNSGEPISAASTASVSRREASAKKKKPKSDDYGLVIGLLGYSHAKVDQDLYAVPQKVSKKSKTYSTASASVVASSSTTASSTTPPSSPRTAAAKSAEAEDLPVPVPRHLRKGFGKEVTESSEHLVPTPGRSGNRSENQGIDNPVFL